MAATEKLGLEVAVEGFRDFMSKMGKMDGAIDDSGKKWGGLGTAAGGVTGILKTVASVGMGAVVAAAAAAVSGVAALSTGLVALGVAGIKTATDFQSRMSILEVATQGAGVAFDDLHDAALAVGGDTRLVGVTATGAADSMTNLYKAGLTTTEIFGDLQSYLAGTTDLGGALRASIDLAAASELDMVQASELAAVMLATFGGEMETEEERANFINTALNNMVQAADASVAGVSDMSMALTNVGPVAAQFGFGIEDVNNALAILSTRGIRGSEAGTSLRSMMTNMMRPTDAVKDALSELNVSLYDQEGVMLSLPEIIGQFEQGMVGLTEEQRNQYIQTIAGTYGMRAFTTLLGEGTEGWNEMAEATANAAGISEYASAKAETFAGKMEALEGTVETLKIGIGEALLPVVTELAGWFAEMVTEHGPQLQALFEAIGEWIMTNLPPAIEAATMALETFSGWWEETWPKIQTWIENVWAVIKPIWDKIVQWLSGDAPEALGTLSTVWQEVWGFIQELTGKVVKWFQDNLPLIEDTLVALQDAGQALVDFWNDHIVPALDDVWDIIKEIFSGALDALLGILTLGMQAITGDWEGAWETVKGIGQTIWDSVVAIAKSFIEGVCNAVGTTTEELVATWENNWEAAKLIVSTIWGNIVTAVTTKVQEVYDGIVDKVEEIRDWWEDTWDDIKDGFLDIWQMIRDEAVNKAVEIYDIVTGNIEEVKKWIGDQVEAFKTLGRNLLMGLRDGILGAVSALIQAVKDAIGRAIKAAEDALAGHSPSQVFYEIGLTIGEGLVLGIEAMSGDVQTAIADLLSVGGVLGGVGRTAARLLRERYIEPLEAEAKAYEEAMERNLEDYERYQEELAYLRPMYEEAVAAGRVHAAEQLLRVIQQYERSSVAALNLRQQAYDKMTIALQKQALAEERLLELERAREELAWLQQQVKLLDMIREHGLDVATILGGLELGIDADIGGVVDAMTRAVRAIVDKVNEELQIASPSRVFQGIGQKLMAGLSRGIGEMTPVVQAQIAASVSPMGGVARAAPVTTNVVNHYYNLSSQSIMRPGGLAMEFAAMELASR